jgi:YVTN family beta-propeller protein
MVMGTRALAIAVLLEFLAAGCAPLPPAYQPASSTDGVLRLYLQPLPEQAHRLSFSITEILAVRNDGDTISLRQSFRELRGRDLIGLQKRLVSAAVPPGSYKGISLRVGEASLLGEAGAAALLTPDEPLFIEGAFEVLRERSSTLFLSLEPEELVGGGFSFTPVFTLEKPRRQLKSLLGFATNSGSNVVSVVNKYTMEVVDTIATGSGPMGAVLDQRREWVYVALAGDAAIGAIDVGTGVILHRARLNFGDEPVEIALSPDGEILVSANRGSNTASIIDAGSLREIERIRLPSEPTSVVMSTVRPRAFLLQPLANAISVIDLDQREIVVTLTLEETPLRGAVSEDGTSLYVITQNSPNLLVIEPTNLSVTGRVFVGTGAASIKVDPKTGLVYIGKRMGVVSVVDPSLLMPIDTFRVDGNAVALDIDDDGNNLFVVSSDRRAIQKLGLINQRVSGVIEVEEGCYAVVMMGER